MEHAASTRRQILDEADRLFRAGGYLATTLTQIANAAGVSVQTVYNLVGGKDAVLKAAYDRAVTGDDAPVPMAERPLVRAMIAADSAPAALRLYAQLAREIGERVHPLISVVLAQAASGNAEVAQFADTIERERGFGTAATARHIATAFGLRPDLEETEAADLLWALSAPELAERLVTRRGWSWQRYQDWLADAMIHALTPPAQS